MKVLVSWIATNHDFIKSSSEGKISINEDGPHFNLYKDFGDEYDIHYLLSQHTEDGTQNQKWEYLANELKVQFRKRIMLRFMSVDDIFDVGKIKGKVEELVKFQLAEMDVEVFMNPGAPSMQTAWYLLGSELYKRKTIKFFKRRERKYAVKGSIPQREYVKFDISHYAKTTNYRDNYKSSLSKINNDFFISESYKNAYDKAKVLASNHSTTILITGDVGTGKTYLAKFIHKESNRKASYFKTLNCSAYAPEVLERLLFGYEVGAFDGAKSLTTGILEQNRGGTVLLKEVDTLDKRIQVQLTEVLISKSITRIGANKSIPLDVRLIFTSTKNLWKEYLSGNFRLNLYHRISIAELKLPLIIEMPHKEKKDWINYFLRNLYVKLDCRYIEPNAIDEKVWDFLLSHPFSGNLSELSNLIEVFYTLCDKKVNFKDIPQKMFTEQEESPLVLEEVTRIHVQKVVELCKGNVSRASKLLDLNRATVNKYLK